MSKGKMVMSQSKKIALKLSENALRVLQKRYLRKDSEGRIIETPAEMFRRVAKNISLADTAYQKTPGEIKKLEDHFYEIMSNLEFLPNSPTLMNAGTNLQQLSACFVLSVDDSIESIYQAIKDTAIIHKSGGGTGFSFSKIRPKGSSVGSTSGVASGPVSFMKVFDASTEAIKQGGRRRGANMGILHVTHPDIMEFIECKQNEGTLRNFNISVAATDQFMKAATKGATCDLIDPITGEITGKLKAEEVINKIAEMAWKNGEPGLVFLDRINQDNPTPQIGKIESTNPCITSDTWIMTIEGPRQVKELVGKSFLALINGKRYESSKNGFFKTGIKPLYRLKTAEGFELRLTKDHLLMKVEETTRYQVKTKWVSVESLKQGNKIIVHNHRNSGRWEGKYTEKEGYLIGLLLGDGTIKKDKTILSSWGNSKGAIKVRKLAQELGLNPGEKLITEKIEKTSQDFYQGLLRGLFDADGSVQGNHSKGVSVRLSQSNLEILKAVQRMLLRLGIFSKIYANRRKAGKKELSDGKGGLKEYQIKAQHELVISKDNLWYFYKRVGFGDLDKMEKLEDAIKSYNRAINRERFITTVKLIISDVVEEVYDVQIPGINAFDANGFYVHNCGEQPLLPYESCNLGSINLAKMVEKKQINWEKLKKIVYLIVHFLDNVIDINKYPLPKIAQNTQANRKIGLGIMGFADLLIKMEIPYNSPQALLLAEKIMKFIQRESRNTSAQLAKERGTFPNYPESSLKEKGLPLRNATTTTIAPTGSISMIANCSSGIEPLFSLVYYKEVLGGEKFLYINEEFARIARKNKFYSKELMEEISRNNGSCQKISQVPAEIKRIFVTALDMKPETHLKMQAAFQKYIDNAVSKTINLPNHTSSEKIKESFFIAHQLGCKGITVYREGSREEQVIRSKIFSQKEAKVIVPRPRDPVTYGMTIEVKTGCGDLYVTINENKEKKLFEVFVRLGKSGGCAASQTEAIGRLVSLAFRSGIPWQLVTKQLRGISCDRPRGLGKNKVLSCADAVAKAIEYYQKLKRSNLSGKEGKPVREKADTLVNQENQAIGLSMGACPECGSGALEYQEGCFICRSCGYTECS